MFTYAPVFQRGGLWTYLVSHVQNQQPCLPFIRCAIGAGVIISKNHRVRLTWLAVPAAVPVSIVLWCQPLNMREQQQRNSFGNSSGKLMFQMHGCRGNHQGVSNGQHEKKRPNARMTMLQMLQYLKTNNLLK